MTYLRSRLRGSFSTSIFSTFVQITISFIVLATLSGVAQEQESPAEQAANAPPKNGGTITIPSGTHLALVLTQPVQSRNIRRGDDIYAQITSPVDSGNQVAIPPGTFVQGTVDKIGRQGSRGELRLQAMSITFPDGYVAPISGPITLESTEGYAVKDPGSKRTTGALILPLAGVGAGALIGHAAGSSSSTLTTTLPSGCVGPPPGCLSSSMTVPGNSAKNAIIGAGIGGAIGAVGSMFLILGSHHFYLDAGAPVEATLQQPVTLERNEIARAVKQSAEHPVAQQAVAPRPIPPVPDTSDHGTCYTPGTPGTPATVIPGAPGPDGIPGPPTIIPGTPPTAGTPYPCP